MTALRSALAALAGAVRRGRRAPEPEAYEEEGDLTGSLDWAHHAPSLRGWTMARPEDREGADEPVVAGVAEQTNAMARTYFETHNLDEHLEVDEASAFVAYSIAELYVTVISYWMMHMQSTGLLDQMHPEARSTLHRVLFSAVTTLAQRPSWYAAAHLTGVYEAEPFGDLIPVEDLPPMIVTEEKQ